MAQPASSPASARMSGGGSFRLCAIRRPGGCRCWRGSPRRRAFTVLAGRGAGRVPMRVRGVDGGSHATSGVVPELTRRLYDLARANQIDQARALQFRLLELFDNMLYTADFPEGFRAAV